VSRIFAHNILCADGGYVRASQRFFLSAAGVVSDVEAEVDNVTVLHRIFPAFQANGAVFFGLTVGSGGDEIVVMNHFRSDEAFLYVGMDGRGRIQGGRSLCDGLGTDFIRTHGKKRNQAHQLV
jgi:hypothetical protein